MILSDVEILENIEKGEISISPFEQTLVRPSSVCLRLGREYLTISSSETIDLRNEHTYPIYDLMDMEEDGIVIPPKKLERQS